MQKSKQNDNRVYMYSLALCATGDEHSGNLLLPLIFSSRFCMRPLFLSRHCQVWVVGPYVACSGWCKCGGVVIVWRGSSNLCKRHKIINRSKPAIDITSFILFRNSPVGKVFYLLYLFMSDFRWTLVDWLHCACFIWIFQPTYLQPFSKRSAAENILLCMHVCSTGFY